MMGWLCRQTACQLKDYTRLNYVNNLSININMERLLTELSRVYNEFVIRQSVALRLTSTLHNLTINF